jgi:hypothetical protein
MRLCCIKGFDHRSFAFNTMADPAGYDRQFEILDESMSAKGQGRTLSLRSLDTFIGSSPNDLDAAYQYTLSL